MGTAIRTGPLRAGAGTLLLLAAFWCLPERAAATSACGAIITNSVDGSMLAGYVPPLRDISVRTTYSSTAEVLVVCPLVGLTKDGPWREASSGTTFAFTVCLVNETSDSVWNVTMTDAVPQNMVFRGWPYNVWSGGNYQTSSSVPTLSQTYSASLAGPWTAGTPADGQDAPLYLRWVVSLVAPSRSACVTYSVQIL